MININNEIINCHYPAIHKEPEHSDAFSYLLKYYKFYAMVIVFHLQFRSFFCLDYEYLRVITK